MVKCMKALRLKLFQETASYTKPFAFKVGETYPLPPYSTVLGMLHKVLNAKSYHDMRISVQGRYEDKFVDYRKTYLFKKKEITAPPLNVHLLFHVHLIIHVHANEELLSKLHERLMQNAEYLSLGRQEDLVRIDEVSLVELSLREEDGWIVKNDIYVPVYQLCEEVVGVRYRLNSQYRIINQTRVWDLVDVVYVSEGDFLEEDEYLVDSDEYLVYFHKPLERRETVELYSG